MCGSMDREVDVQALLLPTTATPARHRPNLASLNGGIGRGVHSANSLNVSSTLGAAVATSEVEGQDWARSSRVHRMEKLPFNPHFESIGGLPPESGYRPMAAGLTCRLDCQGRRYNSTHQTRLAGQGYEKTCGLFQ